MWFSFYWSLYQWTVIGSLSGFQSANGFGPCSSHASWYVWSHSKFKISRRFQKAFLRNKWWKLFGYGHLHMDTLHKVHTSLKKDVLILLIDIDQFSVELHGFLHYLQHAVKIMPKWETNWSCIKICSLPFIC